MQPNAPNSPNDCGQIADQVIEKFIQKVRQTRSIASEPGVEITQKLFSIIDRSIEDAIRSDCDLFTISREMLVNAFRCNHSIPEEAHKTIHLLIGQIIQSALKYRGDIYRTVDGLLNGIKTIASEQNLNAEVAMRIAKEDTLSSIDKAAPGTAQEIQNVLNGY